MYLYLFQYVFFSEKKAFNWSSGYLCMLFCCLVDENHVQKNVFNTSFKRLCRKQERFIHSNTDKWQIYFSKNSINIQKSCYEKRKIFRHKTEKLFSERVFKHFSVLHLFSCLNFIFLEKSVTVVPWANKITSFLVFIFIL